MALTRKHLLLGLAAAGLALISVLSAPYLRLETFLDHRALVAREIAEHPLRSAFAFGLLYYGAVVLSLPAATLLTILGSATFGAAVGGSIAVIAATLGACTIFLAAQGLFRPLFTRKAAGWIERIRVGFQADAASYLLFLRLTPVFPFVIVNIAAALLGSRLRTFFWTTLIGIIPATTAYSMVGAGLGGILDKKAAMLNACRASGAAPCTVQLDLVSLLSRETLLALGALALMSLISILVRRLRDRGGPTASA